MHTDRKSVTKHAINHSQSNVVINDDLWTGSHVGHIYNTRAIIARYTVLFIPYVQRFGLEREEREPFKSTPRRFALFSTTDEVFRFPLSETGKLCAMCIVAIRRMEQIEGGAVCDLI